MGKIRVMIVDDSMLFREFLRRSLSAEYFIEVVGAFGDPLEAMQNIQRLQPDVLAVDMEMPKMRGNEFLRNVLPKHPRVKAVVISSLSSNVFDAMSAGAIDFVGKPNSRAGYDEEQFIRDIVRIIKIAASTSVRAHPHEDIKRPPTLAEIAAGKTNLLNASSNSLIAIGASTGGTEAILAVLKDFPAKTPGVVIVQHMPPGFTQMYAERVDRLCLMNAREAKNGDRVEQGKVLIAPGGDQHMRVRQDSAGYWVSLAAGPKVSGHCPSVDVLFESVATTAKANAVGVLLTGMGADGAKNLCMMRQAGAHTIGQDEESCVVYGMPKVAYDLGGVAQQLPLSAIGQAVMRRFSK
ncbi:MAG: chemotaxis response regulator protein-glutamate methylesterase [Clostridiales bacterium]|nr:chemotaxis response regulator protein-glutamate methylesterase [Clostridiales bacterium]